jgi:Kef-type K+ transport system membrane component KefB
LNNLDLFVQVCIACLAILIAAAMAGRLMRYLKQPAVVGEMIAGVLLGPTLLGALAPTWSEWLFPADIQPILFVLSNIGLSFYMFLVGMEMDLELFNKPMLKRSGALTLGAVGVPFGAGIACAYLFQESLAGPANISLATLAVFLGTALAITAFPMLARILQERNIIRTPLGGISMLSAALQDVSSWILLSFIISLLMGRSIGGGFLTLSGAFLFGAAVWWLVRPYFLRLSQKQAFNQSVFAQVIIALLAAALITDRLGLYSVFGGFILGLAMPRQRRFNEALKVRMYDLMVVFLLPLFFAYSGLNTDLSAIGNLQLLIPAAVILGLAMLSKILPVYLIMRAGGFSNPESKAMAVLMNARGLMVLIIANIGLTYQIINRDAFSILVLLAVISTLLATPLFEKAIKADK